MAVRLLTFVAVLFAATSSCAQSYIWNADVDPVTAGWTAEQLWCDPEVWAAGGWFFAHVELCPGQPPPGGQTAAYRRSLQDFDGAPDFYFEFALQTDAPRSEIPWGGGAGVGIGGVGGVNYVFFISRDQVKVNRDNLLPIIFVDLQPDVPHTFRLELYGTQLYVWYIDGQIIDAGIPEGQFPSARPSIVWVTRPGWVPNTTRWDFISYGRITQLAADSNCDGGIDNFDIDPFILALSDPDIYGAMYPSCNRLTADCNADGRVDNFDVDAFVELLGGS